jgi:pimeloyl-ACP methyl ester carboxylesterase
MDYLGLSLLLLSGLVLGVVLLAVHTARTLTRPPRRSYAFAVARGLPADPGELVFTDASGVEHRGISFDSYAFRSRGLDLPVWDMRGLDPLGPVVVVSHGWGDSRVVSLVRAPELLERCSRLVLWDMPGHADAPGTCSLGVREPEDLAALLDALPSLRGPVVLYGHSLGAGVAIEAGARLGPQRVRAVIAEAPYARPPTPARNVLRMARLPYRLNLPVAMAVLRPRFDRAARAADLRVPLLVLHGERDAVCPMADARAIAGSAPDGTLAVIPAGGHVDLYADPRFRDGVRGALGPFFQRLRISAPAGVAPVPHPTR